MLQTLCPAPCSVISIALSVGTTLYHWQTVRFPHGTVQHSFGIALVLDYDRDMMDVLILESSRSIASQSLRTKVLSVRCLTKRHMDCDVRFPCEDPGHSTF